MNHRLYPLLGIALAALVAGCKGNTGLKDAPPDVKFIGVASARIEYKISVAGKVMGHMTSLYANYGTYTSTHIVIDAGAAGNASPQEQLIIQDDTVMISIDLKAKKGVSATDAISGLRAIAKQIPNPENRPVKELLELHNGARSSGTATVAGKECTVYETPNGATVAYWKGLMLRLEMPMGGVKQVIQATSLDTDISLSHADFEPPDDVTVTPQSSDLPPGHPPMP